MKILGINIECINNENKNYHYIYSIKNIKTNKYYIGSCTNKRGIISRFRKHINELKIGTHHSTKLQNSFNHHDNNFDNWEFKLIKKIEKHNYKYWEQYYINKYDSYYNGYNSLPIVGVINHSQLSDNHKKNISRAKQNLNESDVINIFTQYNNGLNYKQIGLLYNTSYQTISNIINKEHYYEDIKEKNNLKKTYYKYIFYEKEKNKLFRVQNFTQFCNDHNLNSKMMMPLMQKKFKKTFIDGWTAFKKSEFSLSELKERIRIDDKCFTLYKNNVMYTFKSVKNFCKKNKLDETKTYHVLNGVKKSIKGFTL